MPLAMVQIRSLGFRYSILVLHNIPLHSGGIQNWLPFMNVLIFNSTKLKFKLKVESWVGVSFKARISVTVRMGAYVNGKVFFTLVLLMVWYGFNCLILQILFQKKKSKNCQ